MNLNYNPWKIKFSSSTSSSLSLSLSPRRSLSLSPTLSLSLCYATVINVCEDNATAEAFLTLNKKITPSQTWIFHDDDWLSSRCLPVSTTLKVGLLSTV